MHNMNFDNFDIVYIQKMTTAEKTFLTQKSLYELKIEVRFAFLKIVLHVM